MALSIDELGRVAGKRTRGVESGTSRDTIRTSKSPDYAHIPDLTDPHFLLGDNILLFDVKYYISSSAYCLGA